VPCASTCLNSFHAHEELFEQVPCSRVTVCKGVMRMWRGSVGDVGCAGLQYPNVVGLYPNVLQYPDVAGYMLQYPNVIVLQCT
jgi:hypothetical protein